MMDIFIEMISYPFMVRAIIVGCLVSLCASLLGTSLVLKRYSMIGDGLSHVGFAALAIAYAFHAEPLTISIPACIAAAFFLLQLKDSAKIKGDSATALLCSGALAIVSRIKNLENKGHGHLLSLLDKYGRKENWKLLVIGKGNGLPLLKTKIRAMHLSDKVLCLGHRTDVEHLLNAADLTVLPSRFETFGLVLAEGMAMGKPAIAFSVGGTPEIVKDGETGFLVEKDNEKELYECIKQLDSDRSLLKQFSENGIRWVRSRFTNRRMVDDLEVIYHKLSP